MKTSKKTSKVSAKEQLINALVEKLQAAQKAEAESRASEPEMVLGQCVTSVTKGGVKIIGDTPLTEEAELPNQFCDEVKALVEKYQKRSEELGLGTFNSVFATIVIQGKRGAHNMFAAATQNASEQHITTLLGSYLECSKKLMQSVMAKLNGGQF